MSSAAPRSIAARGISRRQPFPGPAPSSAAQRAHAASRARRRRSRRTAGSPAALADTPAADSNSTSIDGRENRTGGSVGKRDGAVRLPPACDNPAARHTRGPADPLAGVGFDHRQPQRCANACASRLGGSGGTCVTIITAGAKARGQRGQAARSAPRCRPPMRRSRRPR